jgi:hypothetical protein
VMVNVDKYIIIHPKSGQNIIQNLCPESLSHFQKQDKESVRILTTKDSECWLALERYR